jgi:DNA-binding NarL/FixJ family response regulator
MAKRRTLAPPKDLRASRLVLAGDDRDSDEFVLFEWPESLDLPSDLTPGLRDVALGMLRGESNRVIAQRRGTSERTVANQAVALFRRFGVASRTELVALFAKGLAKP